MNIDPKLTYVDEGRFENWYFNKYYYCGGNLRYFTFQIAFNLLYQFHRDNPVIIETGCQSLETDLGHGMSTSILAEYISKYGGKLTTIDINQRHIDNAKGFVSKLPPTNVEFVVSDSVKYLKDYTGVCHLLYLDSVDYPLKTDEKGELIETLDDPNYVKEKAFSQNQCLNEFLCMDKYLPKHGILLLDDNMLPGGGKPELVKPILNDKGYVCLLDFHQSLWLKL